uniref:FAM69 protein-kinase domain-containing protein n=1 Tax=Meloidogyne incognita TaxID=6306 RepID=A0A914MLS7_MELIC
MMDNDMLYTETKLNEILTSQSCLNDSDCGLFDCESRCNIESGFCSSRTNDNVDVFCKKLVNQQLFGTFWSKSNKYLAACHQDPVNASQRLNELRLVWSWTLSDV